MTILDEYNAYLSIDPEATRWEFVAGQVFDLTTYDEELDELLVKDIIEVFTVIKAKTNFEYIASPGNLLKYTRTINLGNCMTWLGWGTSVRGAWFKDEETEARFDEVMEFLGVGG